jgi:predicted HTH domain antitoxin
VKSKVVPLRIPETLDSLAASCSQEQHTDKATTLRQWLYEGAEAYAVKLVEQGRISAGRAAELLDMSIYDIYRIAQESGIELGATEEQHRQSMEHARRFMERTRARNA